LPQSIDRRFHPPGYKHRAIAQDFTPTGYLRDGYDYSAFRRMLLEPLGPGGGRRCQLKYWNSAEDQAFPENWVTVSEGTIVLIDGAFLLLPELRDCWDLSIWLEVDWETALLRAESRDVAWVGSAELVRTMSSCRTSILLSSAIASIDPGASRWLG
jgi:uridine kinase